MDGWMEGGIDKQVDKTVYRNSNGLMDGQRQMDKKGERIMDGQTDRQIDEWMDRQIDRLVGRQNNGWMDD